MKFSLRRADLGLTTVRLTSGLGSIAFLLWLPNPFGNNGRRDSLLLLKYQHDISSILIMSSLSQGTSSLSMLEMSANASEGIAVLSLLSVRLSINELLDYSAPWSSSSFPLEE
jgi:hypothetical protein